MENKDEVIQSLEARASFYRMLSSLYFKPLTQDQIDNLASIDWMSYADINDEFAQGVQLISKQFEKRHSGTREILAAEFTSSFGGGHTYKSQGANPYESVFATGEYMHGPYMDVYKAYKAENIKRRENFDYPEDHISFMFQFEAMLSDRAVEAINDGDDEKAKENLTTALDFKKNHIDNWFDDLVKVAELLLHERFYRGVLHVTKGFLLMDSEDLAELIELL